MKEEKHVAKIKSKNNRTYILFFLKTFLTYIFMRDFYTIHVYICVYVLRCGRIFYRLM